MQIITIQPPTVFQSLADATRLRIMRLLASTDEEVCLCELVDSLQEPTYKLSRHLKILRQAGLLSSQKDGRWVYHRLVSDSSYLDLLVAALRALPDDGAYGEDLSRFEARMCLREGGRCRVGAQFEESKMAVS
jgi:ArsR family transcriptional regulator